MTKRKSASRKWWLALLAASMAVLVVAMLLPGPTLEWFYSPSHALGRLLGRLEQTAFPFSRWFHMLMFAWLAACLWGVFPRLRGWQVAGVLLALAVMGELAQIPVPGRNPAWEDLADDLLGIVVGVLLAAALRGWAGRTRRPAS
ncbi:MAG: VanZ family protein [Pseudoxanthomonas sp.]